MWDFFKAFAGPIATVIASIVAVSVTGYFAWCQKNIAEQQRKIAADKLRLDLFDRRYSIFETIFSFYNALIKWEGTIEQKNVRQDFFLAYQKSRFLFGNRVENIFKELLDAGNKVIGFKENKEAYQHDREFLHKTFNETQDILVKTFDNRLQKLKSEVHDFIDFSKL